MLMQFLGYNVEEKLFLEVQKRLNTTDIQYKRIARLAPRTKSSFTEEYNGNYRKCMLLI
jgi:hypothetical protein